MSITSEARPLRTYQVFNAKEYAELPEDRTPWIIRDLLPAGGSALISGPPKARKTLAAQQMAYAIAMPSTDEWLTFPVESHGPVLYLQLDTARTIWKERVKVYREVNQFDTEDVYIADKQSSPFPFEILNPEHYAWLRGVCDQIKPVAVFVDVMRKATMTSENDSDAMMKVCNALESAVMPAALVILAHVRKPAQIKGGAADTGDSGGGIGQDSRGSSALPGNVDSIMKVTKKTFRALGRTFDERQLKLSWSPDTFLFSVDSTEFDKHLDAVVADATLISDNAKAKALMHRIEGSRGIEACRSAIRRKLKRK
jgi:hypothetical protein